jgi:hypothetical protein
MLCNWFSDHVNNGRWQNNNCQQCSSERPERLYQQKAQGNSDVGPGCPWFPGGHLPAAPVETAVALPCRAI